MSRNSKTSAAQQLKLVMECRKSGKTDAQWCIENGIRPATFYNWVSRLRKRGCDIPESNWNELELPAQHQDVVLLDVIPKSSALVVNDEQSAPASSNSMLLEINGAKLTIPNGADSSLLTQVILAMRGSLTDLKDIWNAMVTKGITRFRTSNAAAVGHMSDAI